MAFLNFYRRQKVFRNIKLTSIVTVTLMQGRLQVSGKGCTGEGLVGGFPLPVVKNIFEKMEHFRGFRQLTSDSIN